MLLPSLLLPSQREQLAKLRAQLSDLEAKHQDATHKLHHADQASTKAVLAARHDAESRCAKAAFKAQCVPCIWTSKSKKCLLGPKR